MVWVRVHAGLITMNLITVNPAQLQISHIRAMDETAMDSTTRGGRHNVVDAARKTLFTADPFAMKVHQAMKVPPRVPIIPPPTQNAFNDLIIFVYIKYNMAKSIKKKKFKSRKKTKKKRKYDTGAYKGFNFYDSHKFLKFSKQTLNKPQIKNFSIRTLIYPYDYREIVDKGIGSIDPNLYGHEVAILGGGAAGLCAAYELMRVGLKPVIYEIQDRLGGRLFDYKFPGDKKVFASSWCYAF